MRASVLSLSVSCLIALSAPAVVFAEDKPAAENDAKGYYFLVLEGQGMPVKQIILNGTNVLGGSVVSQSMPINITQEVKAGANDLELDMVSHPTDSFTTIVQKRTEGPTKVEITRITVGANENKGNVVHKALSFSIEPSFNQDAITTISNSDREEIVALVSDYHKTLKEKNVGKFRRLYAPALQRENKIFPEAAKFFEKVLDREIALLKNPMIEVGAFESNGLVIEPEGDKIKVCRKGQNKPLIESNEIEVESEPLMMEVEEKPVKVKNKKTAQKPPKSTAKQRLVTTKLLFRKIDGGWRLALPQGV